MRRYATNNNKKLGVMEFEGIRVMARVVNINMDQIRQKLDTNKPFNCTINDINYKLLLKSKRSDT
jgi:septum formation topological specificity factor MinE